MQPTGWFQDRWDAVTGMGSSSWLAWAAWAALAFAVLVLIYTHRQVQRGRRASTERSRAHVAMFMEPHAADWHVIELVVRNFGRSPAYDVAFAFPNPPTVAQYEAAADGYADVVPLQLPGELPVLAPGQEWRTVWDSAIDRAELGEAIDSRFTGNVTYYDRPEAPRSWWRFWESGREQFETAVTLDWADLPPVQRIELLTNHDLAKREKQKLELLRGLLSYFHYASQETRPDVLRVQIEKMNRSAKEAQDQWRARQHDEPTNVSLRWADVKSELGKHHG